MGFSPFNSPPGQGSSSAATLAAINAAAGEREGATAFRPTNKYSSLKMMPTDMWANGQSETGTAATHDASAGAVPSYTTADKGSIAIVTVAGTLGGVSVAKGDILHALQDNPTTAAHWAIIADSTTEFDAAVAAAQGGEVWLYGTFLLSMSNADAAYNLAGEYTILNKCGYSAIYTSANNTHATAVSVPRQCSAVGAGLAQGQDIDDELGSNLQQVSYFTLSTAADAVNFPIGKKVEVFTNAIHPSHPSSVSSKGYISNAFIVTSVDLVGGIVYADRVLQYHNEMSNASNIYIIPLFEDRAIRIRKGALFMGAPTIIGGEVGWNLTIDGVVPITATLSGSSTSRVLTVAGGVPDYELNQGVRVTIGSSIFSCIITAKTATTLSITCETKNDRGTTESMTNGTVTFVPAFWTSEFNSTTHGGAIVAQQAHGSNIECDFARLWAAGVRFRFSHFNIANVFAEKVVNIGTGFYSKSWRLIYIVEPYASSRNNVRVRGCGGRHAYTNGAADTSNAFASSLWVSKGGACCENVVDIKTSGDTGAAADTHEMNSGDKITSEVEFVTSYNTAHSYRGIGAQLRSDNTTLIHKQRGGQVGLRIAVGGNANDYHRSVGSCDNVDLDISDLAIRDGSSGHCFYPGTAAGTSKNTSWGFWSQSQTLYTNKTMVTGRMKFKNAGGGFLFEQNAGHRFESVSHLQVGYAGGMMLTGSSAYIGELDLDYSIPAGVATTSSSSVTLGTGSKTFTVATGLAIYGGESVLIQRNTTPATDPRAYFGWGRVVSYNSGTGELVLSINAILGSGSTFSSWLITTGTITPRYGVAFHGTTTLTIGSMKWRTGVGNNPMEIFHSMDDTSGKTINVGTLIIDDPLLIGMPNIVSLGREADFTLKIGIIIYNGQIMFQGSTANSVVAAEMSPKVNYQEFTANGTWTAPIWADSSSRVYVEMIGGGGGGGGGARVAAAGTATGGAGGGAGNAQNRWIRYTDLTSTVAVTIGLGGAGGAGGASEPSAGSNGVAGGNTTFGSYLTSYGGGYGSGGSLTLNSGGGGGGGWAGAGTNGAPNTTGTGGTGGGSNGGNGVAGSSANSNTTGGAGGSGCLYSSGVASVGGGGNIVAGGGSAGGGVLSGTAKAGADSPVQTGYTSVAGGAATGAAGTAATAAAITPYGSSGGGGGANGAGVGGAAGAGTGYGAGGSGGGAAIGGEGGAGAAGRNGLVRVWTYA